MSKVPRIGKENVDGHHCVARNKYIPRGIYRIFRGPEFELRG